MTRSSFLIAAAVALALLTSSCSSPDVGVSSAGRSGRFLVERVIPLPKKINCGGVIKRHSITIKSGEQDDPRIQTALKLLRTLGTPEDTGGHDFTIELRLDPAFGENQEMRNLDQAYQIETSAEKRVMLLTAKHPIGLLNAARTVTAMTDTKDNGDILLPEANILDWPAIAERGIWGEEDAYSLDKLVRYKLNMMEVNCDAGFDKNGDPVIHIDHNLLKKYHAQGVKVIYFVSHIGRLASRIPPKARERYAASMTKGKGGKFSRRRRGFCMNSDQTEEIFTAWLTQMAQAIKP